MSSHSTPRRDAFPKKHGSAELTIALLLLAVMPAVGAADELDGLLGRLIKNEEGERKAVAKQLKKLPQPAEVAAQLVARLGDEQPTWRYAAARALGLLGHFDADTVAALMKAMSDTGCLVDNRKVWVGAALTLGSMPEPPVGRLMEQLNADDLHRVCAAAVAIGAAGPKAKDAVPDLIAIVRKDDKQTRNFAISALRDIGPAAKTALPVLVQMLDHKDFHTQYWACRALGALGADGRSAAPDLVRQLRARFPSVRSNAAAALGRIGPPAGRQALDGLIQALDDPISPVRENAAIALGRWGPAARPAAGKLKTKLQARGPETRIRAAQALARIGAHEDAARRLLVAEMQDNQFPWLAAAALADLKEAAKPAFSAIIGALKATDPETRMVAAETLAKLQVAEARQPLQAVADSDPEADVRAVAREALKALQKPKK